jgi:hypothetical protein
MSHGARTLSKGLLRLVTAGKERQGGFDETRGSDTEHGPVAAIHMQVIEPGETLEGPVEKFDSFVRILALQGV